MIDAPLVRLAAGIDRLNEAIGRAVAWLTLAMVLVTFTVVVLRYLFNLGWIALQESVTFMHAAVFMLGAAYTLKHDGHVRVDILYQKWGARGQAWVDLLGALLLLTPVSIALFALSWDYVATSWQLRESSPETGGLPGVFLLKTTILLMAALILLQGVGQAIRSALVLGGRPEAATEHDGAREL